jgi:hypothetical protein
MHVASWKAAARIDLALRRSIRLNGDCLPNHTPSYTIEVRRLAWSNIGFVFEKTRKHKLCRKLLIPNILPKDLVDHQWVRSPHFGLRDGLVRHSGLQLMGLLPEWP